MSEVPSPRRHVAVAALGLVAILAWLWAGIAIPLALIMTPNPGQDSIVLILKVALVGGWLAILGWLLRDLVAGRLRFVVVAIGAWAWIYGATAVLRGFAVLNWGP